MGVSSFPAGGGGAKEKRVDLFTATGAWTAPAGVSYAIAYVLGGGGGGGGKSNSSGSLGGSSIFGSITSRGGQGGTASQSYESGSVGKNAQANTGAGGEPKGTASTSTSNDAHGGGYSRIIQAGQAVVSGTSYTVTVGAGGSSGTDAGSGGSGYLAIEYYVEA